MASEEKNFLSDIPDEKRDYFESLYFRAEGLPKLPTSEKKAITVNSMDIDCVLLKALQESYVSMDYTCFEKYLKRLKKVLDYDSYNNQQYLVYFPGAHLFVRSVETNYLLGRLRIVKRSIEEGFFGA